MDSFTKYLAGTVVRPHAVFLRLREDPRAQVQAAKAVLLIGMLYTLTVAGLAVSGMPISMKPWLALPEEGYYFREIFFAMPAMFMGWIFASGLMQVLCRMLGGSGSFESTMGTLGFAFTLPTFVTWIPESVGAALFLTGVTTPDEFRSFAGGSPALQAFLNAYQLIAVGWMLALTVIAARTSHALPWWKATAAGLLGLSAFMGTMLVFIR